MFISCIKVRIEKNYQEENNAVDWLETLQQIYHAVLKQQA